MTKILHTNVLSLDVARERLKYIATAEASEDWIQVKASFALSGVELTDQLAEKVGRLIAAQNESKFI